METRKSLLLCLLLTGIPAIWAYGEDGLEASALEKRRARQLVVLAEKVARGGNAAQASMVYCQACSMDLSLIDRKMLDLFESSDRLSELVSVIESHTKRISDESQIRLITNRLILNESTRDAGNDFLKRIWDQRSSIRKDLLQDLPAKTWAKVTDPAYFIRGMVIPDNFAEEGDGWNRFEKKNYWALSGDPVGTLVDAALVLQQNPQAARDLAIETQELIDRNPSWTGGLALLCFLEAKSGDTKRTSDLLKRLLKGHQQSAIPPKCAEQLASVMHGLDAAFDPFIIELCEISLEKRTKNLFASVLPQLMELYARSNRHPEAVQLARRLVDSKFDFNGASQKSYGVQKAYRGLISIDRPVEALLLTGQLDTAFTNSFGASDLGHHKLRVPLAKAEQHAASKITPQVVLDALDRGAFSKPRFEFAKAGVVSTTLLPREPNSPFDLVLSARQETRFEPTIHSATLAILKAAASSDRKDEIMNSTKLDQRLCEISANNPTSLDAAIATTCFAFYRGSISDAKSRLDELNSLRDGLGESSLPADRGLWLVAREAMAHESTKSSGETLAGRVLLAAKDTVWEPIVAQELKLLGGRKWSE
ncbi:MAG: hypothetical protein AAF483_11125 [Planctomycetota bacterium]